MKFLFTLKRILRIFKRAFHIYSVLNRAVSKVDDKEKVENSESEDLYDL